uniref:Uncharacterized protein n=1 Tax=Cannabis sativa TaxID=3483 RepID=A0A803PLJ1_CANSA
MIRSTFIMGRSIKNGTRKARISIKQRVIIKRHMALMSKVRNITTKKSMVRLAECGGGVLLADGGGGVRLAKGGGGDIGGAGKNGLRRRQVGTNRSCGGWSDHSTNGKIGNVIGAKTPEVGGSDIGGGAPIVSDERGAVGGKASEASTSAIMASAEEMSWPEMVVGSVTEAAAMEFLVLGAMEHEDDKGREARVYCYLIP